MTSSEGCVVSPQFEVQDGVLVPSEYLQQRHVTSAEYVGVDRTIARSSTAQNTVLQSFTATWLNSTPFTHRVTAILSRDGAVMTLGSRNRAVLETSAAVAVGLAPLTLPGQVAFSRWGGGVDVGTAGLFSYDAYSIWEDRKPPTASLLPGASGVLVSSGSSIAVKVEVKFLSLNWTGANIDNGNSEGAQTNTVYTGASRIDVFATPDL